MPRDGKKGLEETQRTENTSIQNLDQSPTTPNKRARPMLKPGCFAPDGGRHRGFAPIQQANSSSTHHRGYELIFVEDAMASRTAELHASPIQHIFLRMDRVRAVEEVLESLAEQGPASTSHR